MIPLWESIVCIVLAAIPVIFAAVAFVYGKIKLKNTTKPVEYYPPHGFSPIDVMLEYFGKDSKPRELFNPVMLYWAENGYITIEEDCKRGLKLTKIKDFESSAAAGRGRKRGKTFALEKKLWDALCGKVFYTLAAPSSHEDTYQEFVADCEKLAKTASAPVTKRLKIAVDISSIAALVLNTIIIGATLSNPAFLMMIFPIVGIIMRRFIPLKSVFTTLFFCAWGGIPLIAFMSFGYDASVLVPIATAVVAACLVLYVFEPLIDIRTEKNLLLYGRLEAFKTFLIEAELDELELLVEENPNYYFDILPYCYIFGITEKVKPKFDRIRMDGPAWFLIDDEIGDFRDRLMF